MSLRIAHSADVPTLKALWALCFGDEASYIDRFFEDLFLPEHMVVYADGDTPVSMVAFLPCTLRTPAGDFPCAYLYAMATHPQYQGRGLGQQLLRFAYDYARGRRGWVGLTLVPADEGLFRFYAKTDYQTAFSYQSVSWTGQVPAHSGAVAPISPEEYRRLRELLLTGRVYLDHSLPFLTHLDREVRRTGGGLFRLELPGGVPGCAVAERGEDGLWQVKELLAPKALHQQALAALARHLDTDELTARIPTEDPTLARPFGMARWPEPMPDFSGAYLGLALD